MAVWNKTVTFYENFMKQVKNLVTGYLFQKETRSNLLFFIKWLKFQILQDIIQGHP